MEAEAELKRIHDVKRRQLDERMALLADQEAAGMGRSVGGSSTRPKTHRREHGKFVSDVSRIAALTLGYTQLARKLGRNLAGGKSGRPTTQPVSP